MDVLTLYQNLSSPGEIKNKGNGEYCGPCPSCGGRDRFLLWPEHKSGAPGGRFLCRGCGAHGDAIEFLRLFQNLNYREACEALRLEPCRPVFHAPGKSPAKEWAPEPERLPSAVWMEQAARLVATCGAGIGAGPGLETLRGRGLAVETARALGIGWNPADRYDRRVDWGLDDEVNPKTGRPRKVWLPKGLVLPIRRKTGIAALLIRRAEWKAEDDLPKYWQVKGSGDGCFCIGKPGLPVVLVESFLDAALVWQEGRDLVAACALTGATKKPDAGTTAFLREAPLILWSLDFDEAGTKAWAWWREQFTVKAWPCAAGKDPGEMRKAGTPIRPWLEAALRAPVPCRETHEKAPQDAATPKDDPCLTVQRKSLPKRPERRCAGYPRRCLEGCPDYRGLTSTFCRKLHWWKPWPVPGTGELPTVTSWRGHVRHSYRDGTTRLVGMDAAPSVPASVIPPVPVPGAAVLLTRTEQRNVRAKVAPC